jgi:hypothetical protein
MAMSLHGGLVEAATTSVNPRHVAENDYRIKHTERPDYQELFRES